MLCVWLCAGCSYRCHLVKSRATRMNFTVAVVHFVPENWVKLLIHSHLFYSILSGKGDHQIIINYATSLYVNFTEFLVWLAALHNLAQSIPARGIRPTPDADRVG